MFFQPGVSKIYQPDTKLSTLESPVLTHTTDSESTLPSGETKHGRKEPFPPFREGRGTG